MLLIGRIDSAVAGLALAVFGIVLMAWDGLPPNGPALGDPDRGYEIAVGLVGVLLLAGGAWLGVSSARRMLRHG